MGWDGDGMGMFCRSFLGGTQTPSRPTRIPCDTFFFFFLFLLSFFFLFFFFLFLLFFSFPAGWMDRWMGIIHTAQKTNNMALSLGATFQRGGGADNPLPQGYDNLCSCAEVRLRAEEGKRGAGGGGGGILPHPILFHSFGGTVGLEIFCLGW